MDNGFIKDPNIIEENYQVEDLLDFSKIIKNFQEMLERIEKNSVVGLIGKFGSGKSTMLYQLYKGDKYDGKEWINFDAWKYPERKDLWEGFVLDFAKQAGQELFEKVKKAIDGKQNEDKKTLLNVFGEIIPVIKHFNYFLETSPAKRVFEIQEILTRIIKDLNKEIFIIVEDIDRSGDKGVYFLETLRNFIKTNDSAKKIIVIAPIGSEVIEQQEFNYSYGKCLDYRFGFNPSFLDFTSFIKKAIKEDFIKEEVNIKRLNYLFQLIMTFQDKDVTLRKLKEILRNANLEYKMLSEKYEGVDIGIVIILTTLKHFKMGAYVNVNDSKQSHSNTFGYQYIVWLANKDIYDIASLSANFDMKSPIKYINSDDFIPRYDALPTREGLKDFYFLSDKYLEILE